MRYRGLRLRSEGLAGRDRDRQPNGPVPPQPGPVRRRDNQPARTEARRRNPQLPLALLLSVRPHPVPRLRRHHPGRPFLHPLLVSRYRHPRQAQFDLRLSLRPHRRSRPSLLPFLVSRYRHPLRGCLPYPHRWSLPHGSMRNRPSRLNPPSQLPFPAHPSLSPRRVRRPAMCASMLRRSARICSIPR